MKDMSYVDIMKEVNKKFENLTTPRIGLDGPSIKGLFRLQAEVHKNNIPSKFLILGKDAYSEYRTRRDFEEAFEGEGSRIKSAYSSAIRQTGELGRVFGLILLSDARMSYGDQVLNDNLVAVLSEQDFYDVVPNHALKFGVIQ